MIADLKLSEFIEALSSSKPVPGGGGASAVTGAVGAALAGMVSSLTLLSERHGDVHDEMEEIKARTDQLQSRLLELADEDAAVFAPLAAAYKIPKDAPGRVITLETALLSACGPPLEIMRVCAEVMELFPVLRERGAKMAISDVYAGEILCKAAIKSASFNVFINTKLMKDREKASETDRLAHGMVEQWCG
ncbi:MAG: cyclodeaminase/cyclohydrolase family protein [Oscillospiraceae bacterium]|nr:cyclodeaminase/cyclohydrolase family protein [Oscillospiraceae bacterium]